MRFVNAVDVAAGPEVLWRLLTEVDQMKRWDPSLLDMVLEGDGAVGVGATFVLKVNEFGRESHFHGKVLSHETERRMEFEMEGGRFGDAFHIAYALTPLHGGMTRLEHRMEKRLRGKIRYATPLVWLLNRIVLPVAMRKIKQLAESDAAAAGPAPPAEP